MPHLLVDERGEIRHSEDVQDIITAPPSWLLRWGITLFFCVLVLIIGLSAVIEYPDIVKTQLKISAADAPKAIVVKVSGKIVALLVQEGQSVANNQPLAYIESTGSHVQILQLLKTLRKLQQGLNENRLITNGNFHNIESNNLGELQSGYQIFIQSFLNYQSAIGNGFWMKKMAFLQHDLTTLLKQKQQLTSQKSLQQHDLELAKEEYQMHQKLAREKAETPTELRNAESRFIAKQTPLMQTDASLLTASSNYDAKQKEILELNNQMLEEKARFIQALNSLISQAEEWRNKFVLSAPQQGKVSFAGIIQQNQMLQAGQEMGYIIPVSTNYFGEMTIPQGNMGKIKTNQLVLIKLRGYPFEEFGVLRGHISAIADAPYKDSIFFSKVIFNPKQGTDMRKAVHLKQGMQADAEIVTENATIIQRISRSLFKAIHNR